jgi:hypothetical protein
MRDGAAVGFVLESPYLMKGVAGVADSARKAILDAQSGSDDELPDEIVRALDASAEDLRQDRTEDLRAFVRRMAAELETYLAQQGSKTR